MCHVTTAIGANGAQVTASRNAPAAGDRRNFGIGGPLIPTQKKDV